MLGTVGTILGRNRINIASVSMGRDKTGGTALACLNVDEAVPEPVLRELQQSRGILWVREVVL
jgi:D-3-phosphoglycerate dehydrogenase